MTVGVLVVAKGGDRIQILLYAAPVRAELVFTNPLQLLQRTCNVVPEQAMCMSFKALYMSEFGWLTILSWCVDRGWCCGL